MSNHSIIQLCNHIASRANGGGYPDLLQNPVLHILQSVLTMPLPGQEYNHNTIVGGDDEVEQPSQKVEVHVATEDEDIDPGFNIG